MLMVLMIDYREVIKNFEDDISFLMTNENFTRKEAINLILITSYIKELYYKIE